MSRARKMTQGLKRYGMQYVCGFLFFIKTVLEKTINNYKLFCEEGSKSIKIIIIKYRNNKQEAHGPHRSPEEQWV